MGFIDNVKDFFGKIKGTTESGAPSPTGYEAYAAGTTLGFFNNKTSDYLDEMQGWVASAVTSISDEVGSIDLGLYQYQKDGSVEQIQQHPILDLLFKVNPYTTKFDHFWITQAYLELTGECPWFLEREGGKISNIYFLRPDKFRLRTGQTNLVEGYEYEVRPGHSIPLSLDEVIFLKYPNPAKPYRGIGTLEMAARSIDIDNFSEEWNKQFYANAARPDSILTVNTGQMNEEQKDRLKKSLEKAYQGIKNTGKTMVLFGDMKFEKSGFNMKDMDFLEQQKFSRDKILGIFRVPKAIVAQTEDVNYASAKTAQYIFARYTIKPKMEKLVQQLNEFLLPMFVGTENMFLDYKSPVPEDEEAKFRKYESGLKFGWLTVNEVRSEEGLQPVDGGDDIRIPSNGGSIDEVGTEGKKLTVKQKKNFEHSSDRLYEMQARGKQYFEVEEQKEEIKQSIKKALTNIYKNKGKLPMVTKSEQGGFKRILSEEERKAYWDVKNSIFQKYQKKLTEALIVVFQKQRRSTLIKLGKQDKMYEFSHSIKESGNDMYKKIKLDKKKEIEVTLGISMPIIEQLFKEAGDETFELLQIDAEMDINDDEIQKLLRSKGRKFAGEMVDTTNDVIRKEIIAGVGKGETINELKNRLKGVFTDAEEFRAERIARTESLRFNVSASEQAFIDSGIVEGKKWITNPNACEFCLELAGKTIGLGKVFLKKGDTLSPTGEDVRVFDYEDLPGPPLHPNCECDLEPIFIETKSIEEAITPVQKVSKHVHRHAKYN